MNTKVNHLLKKFINQIPQGTILDIGCGIGINSKYLAKKNYQIIAIDNNKKNIDELKNIARGEKENIKIYKKDIRKFIFKKNYYSAILAFNVLVFMKKSEMIKIIEKIKSSLKIGGILFIVSFNIDDNSYLKFKEKHAEIEKNTFFYDYAKQYWNFLDKGELKKIFSESEKQFQTLFYKERKIKDLIPKIHYHGISELVAKRLSSERAFTI